jgi:hypothetical protein
MTAAIAGAATQSISAPGRENGCFVASLLAMTNSIELD